MNIEQYSKATVHLLIKTNDVDSVINGLRSLLKRRGQQKLLPRILHAASDRLHEYYRKNKTVIRVHGQEVLKTRADDLQSDLKELSTSAHSETLTDTSVIGGYSVTTKNKRIDRTYKTKLLGLYQTVTDKAR